MKACGYPISADGRSSPAWRSSSRAPAAGCSHNTRGGRQLGRVLALVEALELGPGSRVADVGAGQGRYTVALARALTPGYVFATEIDVENLAAIERSVAVAGLSNVTLLESRDTDTRLPPACCDGIFLRHVYHHPHGTRGDRGRPARGASPVRTTGHHRLRARTMALTLCAGCRSARQSWRPRRYRPRSSSTS